MSALDDELKIVRAANPLWSFEQCWSHVESHRPSLFSSTIEMNRLRAKERPGVELVKAQQQAKIERIARYLMQRNPAMTMGQALESTRLALPRVQAEVKEIGGGSE
jgi:hypothetical protein